MTREDLHLLIERYFNAETSVEEERLLRLELVRDKSDGSDPIVQQAKAVLGFSLASTDTAAIHPQTRHTFAPSIWRNVAAIIAAVAVTSSIMVGIMRQQQGECVAYLNGQRVSDRETVMELMFSDLGDMGEASAGIDADIAIDLGDMANAINSLD